MYNKSIYSYMFYWMVYYNRLYFYIIIDPFIHKIHKLYLSLILF